MNIVVTGSSKGMGAEICKLFLSRGHVVYGIDVCDPDESIRNLDKYWHYHADVSDLDRLPDIKDVDILINNAGVQNSGHDIDINLKGVLNCTKKYGLQPHIKSVLNQASVSAHNGAEFMEYTASKGGVVSVTKWIAREIAKYGATCNSISFGGVLTALNQPVMEDPEMWDQIMMMTPLKKWATEKEAAEWVYFFTVVNRSCTGQDLVIDNGEMLYGHFVWPEED